MWVLYYLRAETKSSNHFFFHYLYFGIKARAWDCEVVVSNLLYVLLSTNSKKQRIGVILVLQT